MHRHVLITLRHNVWDARASLMLNVLNATMSLFTVIFIILIVVNLLPPCSSSSSLQRLSLLQDIIL